MYQVWLAEHCLSYCDIILEFLCPNTEHMLWALPSILTHNYSTASQSKYMSCSMEFYNCKVCFDS